MGRDSKHWNNRIKIEREAKGRTVKTHFTIFSISSLKMTKATELTLNKRCILQYRAFLCQTRCICITLRIMVYCCGILSAAKRKLFYYEVALDCILRPHSFLLTRLVLFLFRRSFSMLHVLRSKSIKPTIDICFDWIYFNRTGSNYLLALIARSFILCSY